MKGTVGTYTEIPKTTRVGGGGRPATPLPEDLVGLAPRGTYTIEWSQDENADFDNWLANLQVKLRRPGALNFEFKTRTNREEGTITIYRLDGEAANAVKLARKKRQDAYAARQQQKEANKQD